MKFRLDGEGYSSTKSTRTSDLTEAYKIASEWLVNGIPKNSNGATHPLSKSFRVLTCFQLWTSAKKKFKKLWACLKKLVVERRADDMAIAVLKKLDAENVYRGFLKFRAKFVSSIDNAIEMVYKWIEKARKSKYGSKVDSVLASASENLRKANDFVRKRIDEFEERVFRKKKKDIIIETSGSKGNWNNKRNKKLEPNKIYKVDEYSYFTDKSGRVSKVKGELKLEAKDRNIYQQGKSVEIKDGIEAEDQGGHIIARIFNGPGEQINYVPQSAKLNSGEWRDMERTWQNALSEGKRVDVDIKIVYDGNNKRPKRFNVRSTTIDKNGNKQIKDFKFYNN